MAFDNSVLTLEEREQIRTLVEVRQAKRALVQEILAEYEQKGRQATAVFVAEAEQADAIIKSIEATALQRAATENLMKARREADHA